jgi:hypothetical protein
MMATLYRWSPEESKVALRRITSGKLVPLDTIPFNEITFWRGLFAWELDDSGKRTYFLMEYKNVFRFFNFFGSDPELHLYEVIPENRPCHLYFDCEFLFTDHPDFDGEGLIARLLARVDDRLFAVFGHDEYEVVHLDATTPRKFSRHLIIRSDEFCFKNNIHVGQFVQREITTVPELAAIVDTAVYTKNRCFRCIWSTKFANGKKWPLLPVDGTDYSPVMSTSKAFCSTFITDVGLQPHLIGYPDLQIPTKPERVLRPMQPRPSEKPSCIDEFAIATLATGGWITRRKWNAETNTLNLIVEGTRFCRRIGREHRSNHIYLACRIDFGTIVQKCTDPDCRGFASEVVEIPQEMLDQLRQTYAPTQLFTSQRVKPIKSKRAEMEEILAEYGEDDKVAHPD